MGERFRALPRLDTCGMSIQRAGSRVRALSGLTAESGEGIHLSAYNSIFSVSRRLLIFFLSREIKIKPQVHSTVSWYPQKQQQTCSLPLGAIIVRSPPCLGCSREWWPCSVEQSCDPPPSPSICPLQGIPQPRKPKDPPHCHPGHAGQLSKPRGDLSLSPPPRPHPAHSRVAKAGETRKMQLVASL